MDRAGVFCHSLNPMKHLLSLILLTLTAVSLSSCNTIKGMGEDVSAAGHDVSKAAGAVQNKMSN